LNIPVRHYNVSQSQSQSQSQSPAFTLQAPLTLDQPSNPPPLHLNHPTPELTSRMHLQPPLYDLTRYNSTSQRQNERAGSTRNPAAPPHSAQFKIQFHSTTPRPSKDATQRHNHRAESTRNTLYNPHSCIQERGVLATAAVTRTRRNG
jgi:hypothetical protein